MEAEPECMYQLNHGGDHNMKKRVTVSLDEKLIWLLRHKQAEMMLELNQPVSISYVANFLLNKSFKAENMINSELDSAFVRPNGTRFQADKI